MSCMIHVHRGLDIQKFKYSVFGLRPEVEVLEQDLFGVCVIARTMNN